jgi:MFS family permease
LVKSNYNKSYLREIPNFLTLFIMGFTLSSISPILIEMGNSLSSNPENVILIISCFMFGGFFGRVTFPFINAKINRHTIILISYSISIILFVMLFFLKLLSLFYVVFFLNGLLLSFTWMQAHTSMVDSEIKNKDRVLLIGHIFHAISNIAGPLSSTTLVNQGVSWRYLYVIIIFLIISNLIFFVFLRINVDTFNPTKENIINFKNIFKNKKINIYLLLTLIANFLYVITEAIIVSWAPTFFRLYRFFDVSSAGFALTLLWIGIVLGRIIVATLTNKVKTGYILIILSLLSITSLIFVIISKTEIPIFIAIFFTGLGFSGIVPLLISSATGFFKKDKAVIMSIFFIIPTFSFSLGPLIATSLSEVNMLLSIGITIFSMFSTLIIIISRISYRRRLNF